MGFPLCMLLEGTQGYILVEKFLFPKVKGQSARTPNFQLLEGKKYFPLENSKTKSGQMGFPFCMLLEGTQGYILVKQIFLPKVKGQM